MSISTLSTRSRVKGRGWLLSLLFPALTMAGPLGPAISQPDPDTVVLRLDDVVVPARAIRPDGSLSPEETADRVRAYIDSSRASGSPRPLGLAQGLLDQLPEAQWSPRLYLLRATLRQRLHRFDEAQADLDRVLEAQPDNRQAWLTRYSIALARGNLDRAAEACDRLGQLEPGLLAETCRLEVESFGDRPRQAMEELRQRMAQAQNESRIILDWAMVTLADMASRLGVANAGRYWALALQGDSDDLYRRARFADWLLEQGRPEKALALTEGYEDADTLAVLRAVAMTRLDHPQRDELVKNLAARFEEAQWRGEFLHQWEYARFLLDVTGEAEAALAMAQANWVTQRAHPDRQLLIRAAQAARDEETLKSLGVNPDALKAAESS
jgi:tetratricopeptide (TPR) repeat protein